MVVGVLLLELGAYEKLKYGGHNVDSGEQNYLSTGGRELEYLHDPLSIYYSLWFILESCLFLLLIYQQWQLPRIISLKL